MVGVLDASLLEPAKSAESAQSRVNELLAEDQQFFAAHPEALQHINRVLAERERAIHSTAAAFDLLVSLGEQRPLDRTLIGAALASADPALLQRISAVRGTDISQLLRTAVGADAATPMVEFFSASTPADVGRTRAALVLGPAGNNDARARAVLRATLTDDTSCRDFAALLRSGKLGSAEAVERKLGTDFLAWLDARGQGDRVTADAIRIHESVTADGSSGRTVADTFLVIGSERSRDINAAFVKRYGKGISDSLPQNTSSFDRGLIAESTDANPSTTNIETLVLLRSLNIGGPKGSSGFSADLANVNQILAGKTPEQRAELLHRAAAHPLLNGADPIELIKARSGAFEASVVQTLFERDAVSPERLAPLLSRAEALTGVERQLTQVVDQGEARIRLLLATAERHRATAQQTRQQVEEISSGFFTSIFGGSSGTLETMQRDMLNDAEYASSLTHSGVVLARGARQSDDNGIRNGARQLGEARSRFEQTFLTELGSQDGSPSAASFADTAASLERAERAIRAGFEGSQRIAHEGAERWGREVEQLGQDYSEAIASLDRTERNLRTTRDALVVTGATVATVATGGVAGPAAMTWTLAGRAVVTGVAVGTTIGGLSNTAEATMHVAYGNKSAGTAITEAGVRTLDDARRSLNASVSVVAGAGVAGQFSSEGLSLMARIGIGAASGGAGSASNFSLDSLERYVGAEFDFQKQYGSLPAADRAKRHAEFMAERHLDPASLAVQGLVEIPSGMLLGATGATSNVLRQNAQTAVRRLGIIGADIGVSGGVSAGGTAIQNAYNGKKEILSFDDASTMVTQLLVSRAGQELAQRVPKSVPAGAPRQSDRGSVTTKPSALARPSDPTPMEPQQSGPAGPRASTEPDSPPRRPSSNAATNASNPGPESDPDVGWTPRPPAGSVPGTVHSEPPASSGRQEPGQKSPGEVAYEA
jgi:hypothetical protein